MQVPGHQIETIIYWGSAVYLGGSIKNVLRKSESRPLYMFYIVVHVYGHSSSDCSDFILKEFFAK